MTAGVSHTRPGQKSHKVPRVPVPGPRSALPAADTRRKMQTHTVLSTYAVTLLLFPHVQQFCSVLLLISACKITYSVPYILSTVVCLSQSLTIPCISISTSYNSHPAKRLFHFGSLPRFPFQSSSEFGQDARYLQLDSTLITNHYN